jgi:two-component system, OmpR family, response regulator
LISVPSLSTRVLVVDDDIAIQQMLSSYFGDYGIDVSVTNSRTGMCNQLKERNHALILLDLNLRGEDGLDLLREVRGDFDLPVIIMTGHRRDETDRVLGLELGADDYLTKPFGLREMLARVRVVLRRADQARAQNEKMAAQSRRSRNSSARAYWFGGWMLDRRTRQLRNPQDEPVMLTNGEHALLAAFLDHAQRPLSREQLLQATRIHEDVFDRSIDVQILRLRRKLERDPGDPQFIKTERGVGYVFAAAVDRS